MIEVLKQVLEALEANDKLINGSGTKGGLVYCMDGYYSDCFDVDPINKQTDEAIAAIKEALAQQEQEPVRECNSIDCQYIDGFGKTDCDWCRPKKSTHPPQRTEPVALPCCGYTDASAVKWNPLNGVVQCHNCGQNYTATPQRTWVELTNEESDYLRDNNFGLSHLISAVEAKLKEKNT